MDRWACVSIPALPLQLLLMRHPEWGQLPVAVVTRDAPTGELAWVNETAFRARIRPGLRYSAALGLSAELRAGVVPSSEIEEGVAGIRKRLGRFTPHVEPSDDTPGVFWLDASGLTTLYGSLHEWARTVLAALRASGFRAAVAVGYTRFGTYAVTKVRPGVTVFASPEEEHLAAREVPLARLDCAPDLVEMMNLLGVDTVGEFLCLPASGLLQRFGEEAHELHRRASGDLSTPLHAHRSRPPLYREEHLERPETESQRLLVLIASLMEPLVQVLGKRGDALSEVRWMMVLETRERLPERVRTAAPTLDMHQITDLVRLRLEAVNLPAGVEDLMVAVIGSPAVPDQEMLFRKLSRRDLLAGARSLARLRAQFGEDAVVRAKLEEGHLPEARFRWEPIFELRQPEASQARKRLLVRRFYVTPEPLSHTRTAELRRAVGPFIFSGDWWMRECHREYYFAESSTGKLLWLYFDRGRAAWFMQGEVE